MSAGTPAEARLTLDPGLVTGPVRPGVFGSFVEHMGRGVYGGIYEPGHPLADAAGLRTDVLALVRELGVTTVRYPGGNFVSGYRWEDGVGPVEQRPRRLDLAWHSVEDNEFGLHEFCRWAAEAGIEPMLAVNLGTRGIQEALDLLEYANHPGGTELSERRRAHGRESPWGVRQWCLGNEMDGPWQLGHKTAAEYGRLAAETARAMRQYDPDLRLIACGSSHSGMPTFGSWESTVLDLAYEHVDAISAHAYYELADDDLGSFLASAVDMDSMIDTVAAAADAAGARLGSAKRIDISFDEWNVWYQSRLPDWLPTEWAKSPPISEDDYTLADAVVVGNLLVSLLRHADRVASACQAQLVNTIAPISCAPGGPARRQSVFHPFAATARHARGVVLDAVMDCETGNTARFGPVPLVDAVATYDAEDGGLCVFAVNRDRSRDARLALDLSDFPPLRLVEHRALDDHDPLARCTAQDPHRVRPHAGLGVERRGADLCATLRPVSWNMLRFAPE
jgi:alpha-L-arabinofuranosidase